MDIRKFFTKGNKQNKTDNVIAKPSITLKDKPECSSNNNKLNIVKNKITRGKKSLESNKKTPIKRNDSIEPILNVKKKTKSKKNILISTSESESEDNHKLKKNSISAKSKTISTETKNVKTMKVETKNNKSKEPGNKVINEIEIDSSDSDNFVFKKKVKQDCILSDDDDDENIVSKVSPKKNSVTASSFFGNEPVKQSFKKKEISKKSITVDKELHDDDDFMKTLEKLDNEVIAKKKKKIKDSKRLPSPVVVDSNFKLSPNKKSKTDDTHNSDKKQIPLKDQYRSPESKFEKRSVGSISETNIKQSPNKTIKIIKTPKPDKEHVSLKDKHKSPKDSIQNDAMPKEEKHTPGGRRNNNYMAYKQREGPKALGQISIPEGKDNCLESLTFVLTGVYEHIERDDAKSLIERYGGKVTTSLSKKTRYLVSGRESGPSKIEKAEKLHTKILTEEQLFDLIRTSEGKISKYVLAAEEEAKLQNKNKIKETVTVDKKRSLHNPDIICSPAKKSKITTDFQSLKLLSDLWVDKYKPKDLKHLIGQQGEKSCANKLKNWLYNWKKNRDSCKKPNFSGKPWNDPDGSGFKAALLTGPPGIGKTTMANLVCKSLGYNFVELNASDTRSKKTLTAQVSEVLQSSSIIDWANKRGEIKNFKNVLLMDEVDGMAGNEDRGGIQQLVQLIKTTKVPIICMANDRNHPKMRTLSNYCFDLRVQRPRVEQMKSAMMSIAYKENIKIKPHILQDLIISSNQDIRQTIHNLSMFTAGTNDLNESDAKNASKDSQIGIFDACRLIFDHSYASKSIIDKTDLFFFDYNATSLFVHENYLSVRPVKATNIKNHLKQLALASDSIGIGDIIEKKIRSTSGSWSLLPTQAIFASVLPGEYLRGIVSGMIRFPGWFGKNSTRNKNQRILSQLNCHMRLNITGGQEALNLDYLPQFRKKLMMPLIEKQVDGIDEVLSIMKEYDLLKDDVDNILEVSQWNNEDLYKKVETKTKTAFTKSYNKQHFTTPYAMENLTKKGNRKAISGIDLENEDGNGEEIEASDNDNDDDNDNDITKDAMIKTKKKVLKNNTKPKNAPKNKRAKKNEC